MDSNLIASSWFDKVLTDVGFFDSIYPKTQYGLICFLGLKNIKVSHYKDNEG